jgi:hypothetical protein
MFYPLQRSSLKDFTQAKSLLSGMEEIQFTPEGFFSPI